MEFSSFPPALLLATLFRLSLDVSATRLILTQGHLPDGVGAIIPAFGAFVVRGNIVVGLIVFAILITIQFIVIATGAQRVAEVSARFTLDAMPGKQMAIDADVHAGVLDAEGARRKRARVQREADFYAAMDGAGKFVKGDAIAALVIVALNLAGGVVVGVAYDGMGPLDALQTFAILSIGNALVTTLPAFLISTSMGLMVTRVAGEGALAVDLAAQLIARPDALRTAGVLMAVLAFVPALPAPVFGALALAAFGAAALSQRAPRNAPTSRRARRARTPAQGCDPPAGVGVRAGRRRRALDRRRHRSLRACSRRPTPTRCSTASATCAARWRRKPASSFPACACATTACARPTRTRFACATASPAKGACGSTGLLAVATDAVLAQIDGDAVPRAGLRPHGEVDRARASASARRRPAR